MTAKMLVKSVGCALSDEIETLCGFRRSTFEIL